MVDEEFEALLRPLRETAVASGATPWIVELLVDEMRVAVADEFCSPDGGNRVRIFSLVLARLCPEKTDCFHLAMADVNAALVPRDAAWRLGG